MARLFGPIRARVPGLGALVLAGALAGCAEGPTGPAGGTGGTSGFVDPFEAGNRQVHAFNVEVNRAIVQPLLGGETEGRAQGAVRPVRRGLRNLADNLDAPRVTANHLLQGRVVEAGQTSARFALNTLFGLGGLLDPASEMGVARRDTDFGETLHVWGAGEGAYFELPFLGPTTARDWAGEMVDILANPIRPLLTRPQNRALTAVNALGEVADVSRAAGALGDLLDGSADSYAQVRLIYLQNRRFELARNAERVAERRGRPGAAAAPVADPYAAAAPVPAPASAPASAPVPAPTPPSAPLSELDPYEDPYAF